jgi:hypothetical protein
MTGGCSGSGPKGLGLIGTDPERQPFIIININIINIMTSSPETTRKTIRTPSQIPQQQHLQTIHLA